MKRNNNKTNNKGRFVLCSTVVFCLLALTVALTVALTACSGDESSGAANSAISGSAVTAPNGETSPSIYARIYIDTIDSYFDVDEGLHDGMTFLAIDMDGLKNTDENDKKQIAAYFTEKYKIEVLDANLDELEEKGLYSGDIGQGITGILITIDKMKESSSKIVIDGTKWRSGLGANGLKTTLKKDRFGVWRLEGTEMVWIA